MNSEDKKYLSVTALNRYLFYKFDNDLNLRLIYLKAEVSNVRYSKGILYFVLKDNESEINALMYGSLVERLNFDLEDGMTVLVSGKVSIYQKRGSYAVTVMSIERVGLGEAYLNFLRLKEKLLNEGLFDTEHKKKIKQFNHKIGLITSGTGDAMHDVISTVAKRYPLSEVIMYPALVQGEDAPSSLINALEQANNDNVCDCIIIARGGGTIEDLSCFNDERLARKIFESNIPVISGVGHEADYTICDFVSDLRAPTPTGAAMLCTPDMNDLLNNIYLQKEKLFNIVKNKLINAFNDYKVLKNSYVLNNFDQVIDNKLQLVTSYNQRLKSLSPIDKIDNYLKIVNDKAKYLDQIINNNLNNLNHHFESDVNKLILLNPLNIMSKGYTVTFQNGKAISKIEDINKDQELETKILGGTIISDIKEIKYE